jgi:hypothetical protein
LGASLVLLGICMRLVVVSGMGMVCFHLRLSYWVVGL